MVDRTEAWERYHRWMYNLAWKLHKSYPKYLEIEEKFSVGYEALMRAADGYDETVEGTTFMAYSRKVIITNILKAIYKEIRNRYPTGKLNGKPIKYGVTIPFTFDDSAGETGNWGEDNPFTIEVMLAGRPRGGDQLDKLRFDEAVAEMQEGMTDKQKLIFQQHFIEGRDLVDIAKDLGVTKQAVGMKLNELRRRYPSLKREQR